LNAETLFTAFHVARMFSLCLLSLLFIYYADWQRRIQKTHQTYTETNKNTFKTHETQKT